MVEKQKIKNLTHATSRQSPEIKGFNPFIARGFWFLNASCSDNFGTMSSSSGWLAASILLSLKVLISVDAGLVFSNLLEFGMREIRDLRTLICLTGIFILFSKKVVFVGPSQLDKKKKKRTRGLLCIVYCKNFVATDYFFKIL